MTSKTFNPIASRNQLSKLVAEDIQTAIITQKFLPEEKLPSETEFCNQFNVSRTAIREALQTLSARGLIRIEKGRGVFVETLSSKTVTDPLALFLKFHLEEEYAYDVIRARQIIEPPVAGWAAKYRTDEDIEKLEKNLSRHQETITNIEQIAKIDMEFHLILARACNNEVIPLILDPVQRLMPQTKVAVLDSVKQAQNSAIEWHTKIFQHVKDRNEVDAIKAMEDHLSYAGEHVSKMLKKSGKKQNGKRG